MHRITPFLWFENGAEDAARLYVKLFGGGILDERHWGAGGPAPEGSLLSITFEIDGREYQAFNGGPHQPFNDAVSLVVSVDTQEELDAAWNGLLAGGGQPAQCGWLRDRWGMRWQIVPTILGELIADPDPERSARATAAMLTMVKLDIAELTAAADGLAGS